MHEQLFKAFGEDVVALELLEQTLARADAASFYEMSVASDVPAVTMRKYLKRRAQAERA